jgi:cyclopropane-fatty-acyl-phospholipid synthase
MADLTQMKPDMPVHTSGGGSRGSLARHVLRHWTQRIDHGALDVSWPDGTASRHTGRLVGPNAKIRINNTRFVRRAAFGGALGLADSYVDGDWDSPDLTAVFKLAIDNEAALSTKLLQSLPLIALGRLRHRLQANTITGSRRNIAAHYDLGNDFYAPWLDDTMTYSAGLFADAGTSLADAQNAKYARIAKVAGLKRVGRFCSLRSAALRLPGHRDHAFKSASRVGVPCYYRCWPRR